MIECLNCDNCGAALSNVMNKHLLCEYCTTLHFVQELQETVDRFIPLGSEADTKCPVCDGESLRLGSLDEQDVFYCRKCRGLLLFCEVMGQIIMTRRAAYQGADAMPLPLNPLELERNVRCPACEKKMEVHPYHGPGNVVVDSCSDCHLVWLDHGEIARIERSPGRRYG